MLIDSNRHIRQRRGRGTVQDGGCVGRIKDRAMTGANQILAGGVIADRATSMSTGRIIGHELPIGEMDQNAGIAVRG